MWHDIFTYACLYVEMCVFVVTCVMYERPVRRHVDVQFNSAQLKTQLITQHHLMLNSFAYTQTLSENPLTNLLL